MAKHIYCIANSNHPKAVSKSNHDVYSIPYQDISAVVKDVPFAAYSATSDREMLIRYLTEHQSVIEGLSLGTDLKSVPTVIPVKFGTLVRDDADVMEILDIGYSGFKDAILSMDGKAQIEVLALWNNLDEVIKEIGKNKDIKMFKEEAALNLSSNACPRGLLSGVSIGEPSKEYAIELGRMVKRALDEETGRIRDEILNDLKGYVPGIRTHDLMDDRMIMNMAFLIQRNNIHKLYEEIDSMNERYGGDVHFRIIGPLPPYSFSTMEIKRINIHEIAKAMDVMRINRRSNSELAELPAEDEIRAAYRVMLKAFHPDKNPEDHEAQKKFEGIKQAYETLMDCVQGSARPSMSGDVIVIKKVV